MTSTPAIGSPVTFTVSPASKVRQLVVFRYFVLAYCVWQASDLWGTWFLGSSEPWGWLMLGLWLVPALLAAICGTGPDRPQEGLLASAVVLTLVGQITWLNCLQHLALALAIAGWRQPLPGQLIWLAASILWMPACGWLIAGVAAGWETVLRIVGSVAIAAGTIALSRRGRGAAAACLVIWFVADGNPVRADTFSYSPVQATVRPLGLDVVDGVGRAGSDAASADFLNHELPTMMTLVGQNLGGIAAGSSLPQATGFVAVDPGTLKLAVATDVRVYFVGESTGYHNSLGYNTGGGGIGAGDPLLIFPDASIPPSYGASANAARNKNAPLFPGDFVELGSLDAGTELDFFLIANGANNGNNVFSTDRQLNPGGSSRAVAFAQVNNPYVLIGFEDLIGEGERNYSDVLFAVYIGENSLASSLPSSGSNGVPAPEPGFIWLLVAASGGWLYRARRKQSRACIQLGMAKQGR